MRKRKCRRQRQDQGYPVAQAAGKQGAKTAATKGKNSAKNVNAGALAAMSSPRFRSPHRPTVRKELIFYGKPPAASSGTGRNTQKREFSGLR